MANGMKKVVTIGGGTGSYVVLRGLKEFPLDITAIVSMFDSGGSSGVLRDEFGVLPPGDVRRCLVALSVGERASILRDLFNYRFNGGTSLNGHSFGNLLLVALGSIYGSDIEAIRKASELLDIKGKVLPVTLDKAELHAELYNGDTIVGETNIDIPKHDGQIRIKKVYLKPDAAVYEESAKAIREADVIVIGPGDLYTSIVPNLLVKGVPEALVASKGKMVLVSNLMTKWGETNNLVASDIAKELLSYSGLKKFDYVICDNGEGIKHDVLMAYQKEKKFPIKYDIELEQYAVNPVITGDFFSEADIARHDSVKIARIISEL